MPKKEVQVFLPKAVAVDNYGSTIGVGLFVNKEHGTANYQTPALRLFSPPDGNGEASQCIYIGSRDGIERLKMLCEELLADWREEEA